MDNLEKYIKDHKDQMDSVSPPKGMWERVNQEIETAEPKTKSTSNMILMLSKIAAAFAIVLASGIVIGFYINEGRGNNVVQDQAFNDYMSVEQQYVKDINHKMNVLKSHDVDPQIGKDLMQLDDVYNELKNELNHGTNTNNDKIIEALIMNHEVKIEMLEKVLSRLHSSDPQIQLNTLRDDTISI